MEIARIDIKDKNGQIIAWYAYGEWHGLTSVLPSAIHLMVTSVSRPRSAFGKAVEQMGDAGN